MITENKTVIYTVDLPGSEYLAAQLATCLPKALLITFSGEIGTGKTTFIRAMLRNLGITSAIKSPTFSLVESYSTNHLQIHHFDLYRIQEEDELDYLGLRDYFSEPIICCIEWPEHAGRTLPQVDIQVIMKIKESVREIQFQALTPIGEATLSLLAKDRI